MKKTIKQITIFFIMTYILLILLNPFKYEFNNKLLDKYIMSNKTKIELTKKEKIYIRENIIKYTNVINNDRDSKNRIMYIIFFGLTILSVNFWYEVKRHERK